MAKAWLCNTYLHDRSKTAPSEQLLAIEFPVFFVFSQKASRKTRMFKGGIPGGRFIEGLVYNNLPHGLRTLLGLDPDSSGPFTSRYCTSRAVRSMRARNVYGEPLGPQAAAFPMLISQVNAAHLSFILTMLFKSSTFLSFVALSVLTSCTNQLVSTCFSAPSNPNSASGSGNCTRFISAFCNAEAQSVFSPDALFSRDMASRCFSVNDGLNRSCHFNVVNTKSPETVGTIPDNTNCKAGLSNLFTSPHFCDFDGKTAVASVNMIVSMAMGPSACFQL
ncbi:hypothetical protein B0H13DRAFT_1915574 [Mycena leptocephala]|nr:hypothetical protein B0H13DRAFT_1915574 [Mycena leptocephala]